MGDGQFGHDPKTLSRMADDVHDVHRQGVEQCMVIGGGNIVRGDQAAANGIDRANGDSMGMLATVINALALQSALENLGVDTRVQSAIPMATVCEPYIRRRAIRYMERNRVVIFAAGTGNPYFTTDTAAALRAMEIGADVIMKGTKVNGIYDADPITTPTAKRFTELPFLSVLNKSLKVMDATAITLCMDNDLPIIVFNLTAPGNIRKILEGKPIGTIVSREACINE